MDLIGIILAGALTVGDLKSSQAAIARGGRELNPNGPVVGAVTLGAVVAVADLFIQEKHPKAKWYWRGAVVIGGTILIAHNHRVAR